MKSLLLIMVLALWPAVFVFSQNHGVQWIQGPVPMAVMDFRNDTILFHHISDTLPAFIGTANICDKEGNFLFFTNGVYVRDRYGNMLQNGDSLCYAPEWYSAFNSPYIATYHVGLASHQSVLILPVPDDDSKYYIFHYLSEDTSYLKFGRVNTAPLVLYYSLVDMHANSGLGAVIQKNVRLPIYQPMCSSRMTAIKHANGRDWWLIRHGDRDNKYIKFLVTPLGISGPYYQNIGPAYVYNNDVFDYYGASVFNQQGDKMASSCQLGPTVVLDFDRCTGDFSNPLSFYNYHQDTMAGAMGLAFSPNGRFLYVSDKISLNQYDLLSNSGHDSVRLYTVDTTDGYAIRLVQLAPNNKIYVSTWHGGANALHVINNPDEYGLACNFQLNGQHCLTANTNNLPNMVNYKLGALAGSGCDTIISGLPPNLNSNLNSQLHVYPNPASDVVRVTVAGNAGPQQLVIYNALGQVVKQTVINGYMQLDVSDLTNGIYQIVAGNDTGKMYKAQFVVAR